MAACKLLDLLPEAVVAKRESLVDRFSIVVKVAGAI